jgi:stage IV sporulation protein FB
MREYSAWSLDLGRWGGVQVRLHAFFVLFAITAISIAAGQGLLHEGAVFLVLLLLSVLLHEVGHAVAAFRAGGGVEAMVLGPLGGLTPPEMPRQPHEELRVVLAGPAVNLGLCFVSALVLYVQGESLVALLHPLAPNLQLGGHPSLWPVCLKLTFWINWTLMLVNLLPAVPLDGGRALRVGLWMRFGRRSAVLYASRITMLTALTLLLAGWLLRNPSSPPAVASWVPLTMLAVYLFFSAKYEVQKLDEPDAGEELFGYDFSQGYTSLEQSLDVPRPQPTSALRRWLQRRRDEREAVRERIEQEEERRVDEVLARLHTHGMHGLTSEERALLQRVSTRLRNRQQG